MQKYSTEFRKKLFESRSKQASKTFFRFNNESQAVMEMALNKPSLLSVTPGKDSFKSMQAQDKALTQQQSSQQR